MCRSIVTGVMHCLKYQNLLLNKFLTGCFPLQTQPDETPCMVVKRIPTPVARGKEDDEQQDDVVPSSDTSEAGSGSREHCGPDEMEEDVPGADELQDDPMSTNYNPHQGLFGSGSDTDIEPQPQPQPSPVHSSPVRDVPPAKRKRLGDTSAQAKKAKVCYQCALIRPTGCLGSVHASGCLSPALSSAAGCVGW